MTNKKLSFSTDARYKLLKGVNQLADAVKVTMGPNGQTVVIENPGSLPTLTKDGVTVAKSINLSSRFENLGVQLVKEASARTAETAGDGTTTATLIAQCLFSEGLKALAAGFNSKEVQKGMKAASSKIIDNLNKMAKQVESDDQIIQVGTISANGEEEIGELLCQALKTVGRNGVVTVEEAKGFKTTLEKVEGTRLNRGYLSPYFINTPARSCCVLENPLILLANKKILSIQEFLPILEKVHRSGRSLLIVADEVDGDALKGLVLNQSKGILNVCAIRSPEFGESRLAAMEDLAVQTGTQVFGQSDTWAKVELSDLGGCKKVVVNKFSTVFIGLESAEGQVQELMNQIENELVSPATEEEQKVVLSRRLSRLADGVAILRVGGATEAELRERKDRVDDALHATKAAVQSGILPGGGTALVRAALLAQKPESSAAFSAGWDIVVSSCMKPVQQISLNSGKVPELILEKVKDLSGAEGYDARNDRYVDMFETGIIDPTMVVTSAVEHATSVAVSLLSIGCAVIEDIEKNEEFEPLVDLNEIYS